MAHLDLAAVTIVGTSAKFHFCYSLLMNDGLNLNLQIVPAFVDLKLKDKGLYDFNLMRKEQ